MDILARIRLKQGEIQEAAVRHGASNIRIFGSVARGEAKADSDVDVLVDLEDGRSLLDLGGLLMDLQDLLGRQVNIVTENSIHWYIRNKILDEAVPL